MGLIELIFYDVGVTRIGATRSTSEMEGPRGAMIDEGETMDIIRIRSPDMFRHVMRIRAPDLFRHACGSLSLTNCDSRLTIYTCLCFTNSMGERHDFVMFKRSIHERESWPKVGEIFSVKLYQPTQSHEITFLYDYSS